MTRCGILNSEASPGAFIPVARTQPEAHWGQALVAWPGVPCPHDDSGKCLTPARAAVASRVQPRASASETRWTGDTNQQKPSKSSRPI